MWDMVGEDSPWQRKLMIAVVEKTEVGFSENFYLFF